MPATLRDRASAMPNATVVTIAVSTNSIIDGDEFLAGAERDRELVLHDAGDEDRNEESEQQRADGSHCCAGRARSAVTTATAAHTTIITGFSISALNAPISSAPSAPSTAR